MQIAPTVKAAGVPFGFGVAKPFDRDSGLRVQLDKRAHPGLVKMRQAKLYGTADKLLSARSGRHHQAVHPIQAALDHGIARVPARAVFIEAGQLRAQNSGPKLVHAAAVIGCVKTNIVKYPSIRRGQMPVKQHIRARIHDRPGHNLLIVRSDKATLARVNVFIRLGAETANSAESPALFAAPSRAHRVRGVFDQADGVGPANGQHPIHIGNMTAHMREHQKLNVGIGRLVLQVVEIDGKIRCGFDQQGNTAGVVDGARNRRQGIGITQYFIAVLEARRAHGHMQRKAPRSAGQHEAPPEILRELRFQ